MYTRIYTRIYMLCTHAYIHAMYTRIAHSKRDHTRDMTHSYVCHDSCICVHIYTCDQCTRPLGYIYTQCTCAYVHAMYTRIYTRNVHAHMYTRIYTRNLHAHIYTIMYTHVYTRNAHVLCVYTRNVHVHSGINIFTEWARDRWGSMYTRSYVHTNIHALNVHLYTIHALNVHLPSGTTWPFILNQLMPMCVHVCVCAFVNVHDYVICICKCVCMWMHVYTYTRICICKCVYIYVYTYVYICIYIYIYVCGCTCIYIRVFLHAQIRLHAIISNVFLKFYVITMYIIMYIMQI